MPKLTPPPASVPPPAPAPAAPAAVTTPPPAPATGSVAEVAVAHPELVGEPIKGSPAGIVITPDVPAPIPPPYREGDTLPKEGQPSHQGSLTPGQVALKNEERAIAQAAAVRANPAMRSVAPPPPPPPPEEELVKNQDGFIAGAEVTWDQIMAHRHATFVKPTDEKK